jgi:hypothetical protein
MARSKAALVVTEMDRQVLESMAHRARTAPQLARRARIVLACATGLDNTRINATDRARVEHMKTGTASVQNLREAVLMLFRIVRWVRPRRHPGAESISFRGHAGRELFGPVERHSDLIRRTGRLQHQEVLAIGHHGKT